MAKGTVITSLDQRYAAAVRNRAYGLFDTEDIDVIFMPHADVVLLGATGARFLPASEQFVFRDVLHSKVHSSWRGGSRQCLVIASVTCNSDSEYFGECRQAAIRELETVITWSMFGRLVVDTFSPDKRFTFIWEYIRPPQQSQRSVLSITDTR